MPRAFNIWRILYENREMVILIKYKWLRNEDTTVKKIYSLFSLRELFLRISMIEN